jgi:hypothetical protein
VRRFRTDLRIVCFTPSSAALACLLLAGCDAVRFDFGPDGGADSEGTCDAVDPVAMACAGDLDSGCFGGGEVTAVDISESAGCTPAGMALGVASLEIPESGAYDLFAWADPVPWIDSVFNEDVSLAVFPDSCGAETFGGGDLDCDYLPWILKTALPAAEAYLHIQTSAGDDTLQHTTIGFQTMPSGAWDEELPPDSQSMECDTVPNGPLDETLLYPDPLTGTPRPIGFAGKAPASIAGITGAPRICGASAAGWRQAGYLIQNLGDFPAHATGLHIRKTDATSGGSVHFHYGLFACATGSDVVAPEQIALASSCDDSGDHASKEMAVDIELWDPDDSATNYVLVLQIPPGEGTDFYLQFDID